MSIERENSFSTKLHHFTLNTAGYEQEFLNILNSGLKSIPRSTGGLSNCEPYQLLFYNSDNSSANSETRVKVRFKDVKCTSSGEIISYKPIIHTKIVRPQDLGEPFSYDITYEKEQLFMLDLGGILLPIYVIHYAEIGETIFAFFIELETLRDSLNFKLIKIPPVIIYAVDRAVLRYPRLYLNEHKIALKNYYALKMKKKRIFDEKLMIIPPVFISAQKSLKELHKVLVATIEKELENKKYEEARQVAPY